MSATKKEKAVAAGIVRAMARGCLRWDPFEHCFTHVTALNNVPEIEFVQSPRRLAEIAREH